MKYENSGQMNFFSEMAERQISATEFFNNVMLDSLDRNFGLKEVLISYFDPQGKFLSWIGEKGMLIDSRQHPYRQYQENDEVRQRIYRDAVRDHLTYFDVEPRLYRSTDVIPGEDYESSGHVRFLEDFFSAHYSVTMPFGINAYIQVTFFKEKDRGDFSEEEIGILEKIYVYIANSYKNFKKYEQARIVSEIQSQIISSGENAYLVTDDFMHVMSYNRTAETYLREILGASADEQLSSTAPCSWLPFLLGSEEEESGEKKVKTRVIQGYLFRIYTYDQCYSNGIVDRYHWITISSKEKKNGAFRISAPSPLTQTERRVAELMHQGLTYREIADEMVVSYHTVKKHVQNIYAKCGVKSRFQLYKWLESREVQKEEGGEK